MIPNYLHAPGVCYTCRAAQRGHEKIIDTGLWVDANIQANPNDPGFSVQYVQEPLVICESCITELGHMVGMLTPRESEIATAAVAHLDAALEQERSRAKDLSDALDALTRANWMPAVVADTAKPPATGGERSVTRTAPRKQ